MSDSIPPDGSHGGPEPEFLEQGRGRPLGSEPSSGNRRKALLAGAAVAGLALVGAGAWAAVSFFSTGAQPAEALPASTLGYASIDLDPSGGQKIEAVRMLKKFPAIEDEIDLDTDDDLKEQLFTELGLDEQCESLDYADDIEPWLGDRAAAAAVDLGDDEPVLAVAVQVTDSGSAETGLAAIAECAGDDELGWAIDGDWAILAETEEIADEVVTETAQGSLADDEDYQRWTDEVGDPGVLTLYAAPAAGAYVADSIEGILGLGSTGGMSEDPMSDDPVTDEVRSSLEDFDGMAMVLRFDDSGLELEVASDAGLSPGGLPAEDGGADALATLPADTAVAFGLGFADGWAAELLQSMAESSGGSVDDLVADVEEQTGLTLPDDAESLLGDSAAVALGSDFDPEAWFNGDGTDLPVGVKIQGDPAEIETVLDKIRSSIPPEEVELVSEADEDAVAVGIDEAYVATLLSDGGLGDTDAFDSVADDAEDAAAVLFVNFDAGGWVDALSEGDQELADNLEPLQAFGITLSGDDDVVHGVVRLTVD